MPPPVATPLPAAFVRCRAVRVILAALLLDALASEGVARVTEAAPDPPQLRVDAGGMSVVYWPGDSALAVRVLRALAGQRQLPGLPVTAPEPPVRVVLAPSEAIFDSLLGGGVPEWGAGVAVPSARSIVLPSYASPRTRFADPVATLRHEWAHLALHDYLHNRDIPRWFDEGYAEWASGAWDFDDAWRLRIAFALRQAPPLDSLAMDWPADVHSASLAYLLAATAVQYLVQRSGERGLGLLFDRWRASGNFERALRATYGVTSGQLEEDWRKFVKRRYGWLLVLSQSLAFWLGTGFLLLVLYGVRRRRDRLRLARLRAAEPPEQPAWWVDPPPESG
ncbi:MAG: hypothetical protein HY704_05820 [Gemmatimonadetes bacterium]|nr:hypothetical protein [Gemmatimonadota bacterium]